MISFGHMFDGEELSLSSVGVMDKEYKPPQPSDGIAIGHAKKLLVFALGTEDAGVFVP